MTTTTPSTSFSEPSRKGEVTRILEDWAEGDVEAFDRLLPLVLSELKVIARCAMAREWDSPSFQPTELISEVCLKLLNQKSLHWESRSQFYSFSSKLMRRILVDRARRRRADKRDAPVVPLSEVLDISEKEDAHILAVHDALEELEALDPLQAGIVEMRFYGGWTIEETAEALGVSTVTVKRRFASAKLWMRRYLSHN